MTKVYIKTYGCSMNASDSEVIAGTLKKAGFSLVDNDEDAELVIVNTCIVKSPTQKNVLNYLEDLKKRYKKIVVAGCMPQALSEELEGFSMIGVDQLSNIVEVVEETLNDNIVVLIARENNPRLNLPRVKRNKVIEIIPICSGCLGQCSYCVVKRARGNLLSYDKEAIIEQAQKAVLQGAKEIWITAQDTGCYGKDIDSSLPELLKELIKIPGDYKIRIGMMNPNYALEYINELIDILKAKNVFKFVHLPLQAGNDEVLKNMNRKYIVEDFKKVISKLKNSIPDITIATDVICGFPQETDEQFKDTIELIKEIRPQVLNISRYWKRPHTKAAEMKQFRGDVSKSRSRQMTAQFEWITLEENRVWRNWEGTITISEKGKDNQWIGRNISYKPVIVEGDYFLGQKIKVKVIKTTTYDLRVIEI